MFKYTKIIQANIRINKEKSTRRILGKHLQKRNSLVVKLGKERIDMNLLDKVLSKNNIEEAYKRVYQNKGANGVDGITVYELRNYLDEHLEEIKEKIKTRKYKPSPVRRVYIPKENGDKRGLGIPTVIDRVIQQAIVQALTPIYEKQFAETSYDFRPKRSCEMAVIKALEYFKNIQIDDQEIDRIYREILLETSNLITECTTQEVLEEISQKLDKEIVFSDDIEKDAIENNRILIVKQEDILTHHERLISNGFIVNGDTSEEIIANFKTSIQKF